jgi:hypothetical protein
MDLTVGKDDRCGISLVPGDQRSIAANQSVERYWMSKLVKVSDE